MGQITKQIKGKIIFKHETEADWKLSSYVPDEGEQIIYDPDASHSNPRIKIGDGKKVADALPFTTAEIPTKISEFENDVGYLKAETDPTVSAWAKAATKPSYTAAEVGALPSNTKVPTKVSELTNDKGYLTEHQSLKGLATEAYVNEKIGAISTPDVSGQIGEHNVSRSAHNDIREQISQLSSEKVAKSNIFLGIASDGLMYIFVDGEPVGSGVAIGGGDDIFGYVDENNVVVLSGNLPTGAYTIKYEMTDGSLVYIGNLVLDNNVYYTVQNILTNCTTNNSTLRVIEGQSYSATITAKDGYKLSSVTVTMGGLPVSVSGGIINISNVTGNIVIDAVAHEVQTDDTDNILTNGAYTIEMNKRWSASVKEYKACDGMICITIPTADVLNKTIYFKGFTKDLQASSSKPLWIALDANLARVCSLVGSVGDGNIWTATGLTDEGNGVYGILVNSTNFDKISSSTYLKLNMAVNASTAVTSLDGLTMTIDKPIS